MAIFTQAINIYMLAYQHTVEHCIIHFVALEVIMELSKLYLESLTDEKSIELLHHPIKIHQRSRDIKFSERTTFHKIARVLYKIFRGFYASVTFYFVPYTVWFFNYAFVESSKDHNGVH